MESVEDMVENIANSSREHSRGTDLITAAVERMKDLTVLVTHFDSRAEPGQQFDRQGNGKWNHHGGSDSRSMSFTDRQQRLISKSVNNIEAATTANSQATKVMNAAVADLTHQIDLLEKEMTGFKILTGLRYDMSRLQKHASALFKINIQSVC